MIAKLPLIVGGGLLAAAAALTPSVAFSATLAPMPMLSSPGAAEGSPLQRSQFAPGGPPPPPWGAPRPRRYDNRDDDDYDRSYRRRSRYDYCRQKRNLCEDRWGWGSKDYWRCLRKHGCD